MKAKLFSAISIIFLFLTSCSDAFAPATSIPTATSTLTLTITPSLTPTSSPTITPSPTETPDPNRPTDATGRDSNGYYKDVRENGNTVRYYWVEMKYGNNINGIQGWFASHTLDGSLNGGIPLDFSRKMVPFYYYVQEGHQAPYIRQLQGETCPYAPTSGGYFYSHVISGYFRKNWREITPSESEQFSSDYSRGRISISFTTPTGDYKWKLSQSSGFKFYAINWDDADPASHPEFYETHSGLMKYRWAIHTDTSGNLIVVGSIMYRDSKDAEILIINKTDPLWVKGSSLLSGIFNPMLQMLYLNPLPTEITYWQGFYAYPNEMVVVPFQSKKLQVRINVGTDDEKTVDTCITPYLEIVSSNATTTPNP